MLCYLRVNSIVLHLQKIYLLLLLFKTRKKSTAYSISAKNKYDEVSGQIAAVNEPQ